jgi:hypothetical protein
VSIFLLVFAALALAGLAAIGGLVIFLVRVKLHRPDRH